MLVASGWLTDPTARDHTLTEAISGDIDPRAAFARIEVLMGTDDDALRAATAQKVQADWTEVAAAIPRQWRRKLPWLLASGACSHEAADALRAWFATEAGSAAPGHERALAQASESISLCAESKSIAALVKAAVEKDSPMKRTSGR